MERKNQQHPLLCYQDDAKVTVWLAHFESFYVTIAVFTFGKKKRFKNK